MSVVDGQYDVDDLDLVTRLEARFTLLGSRQPACERCGETNAFTLQCHQSGIVCATCAAVGSGKRPTEAHHVAGRHNSDVTADIPASDHRVLSRLQDHWPWDTLVNPDSSPLLAAAASLRGWSDVMEVIIHRVLPGIAPALEELDRRLVHEWGEQWWRQRGIEL